ncbi:MAG: hypothetical protein JWL95_1302 [Gemmatimonadetes bacterium]|nr:hypothetical protein [Gemmatimonadota bacterium]
MSKDKSATGHAHDASDRALDKLAQSELIEPVEHKTRGPGHDEAETRKHDDVGKDRLFEGRQQHDEAEKNSEKTRLARDVQEHHHDAEPDANATE